MATPTAADRPRGFALWLLGARIRTLPAALVPVMVGTAAAVDRDLGWDGGLVWWRVGAALVVSLALQIGVNYANDYSDGIRGTDDAGRVGPPRLVGSGQVEPRRVLGAALGAFAVAGLAGLALAAAAGWWLIAVGAAAIAAGWFYTGGRRPYGYAGLGEVMVFVFFGLVATVGASYVHREEITDVAVVAAVSVGLLAVALLVVNNLRDIPGDTAAGKRTLAVRLGDRATRALYAVCLVGAFAGSGLLADPRPLALLAFAALLVAVKPVRLVLGGAKGRELIEALGATGKLQLAFGVLLASGLWLSA